MNERVRELVTERNLHGQLINWYKKEWIRQLVQQLM